MNKTPGTSERPARDALDEIDEAVARITDDDIGERLRETLRRAGYVPEPKVEPQPGMPLEPMAVYAIGFRTSWQAGETPRAGMQGLPALPP